MWSGTNPPGPSLGRAPTLRPMSLPARSASGRTAAPRAEPGSAARRENQLLRELVAVYSHLSGLASQDADMEGVVRLVAHRTRAAVVVLGPAQQPLAAAPAGAAERLPHGDRRRPARPGARRGRAEPPADVAARAGHRARHRRGGPDHGQPRRGRAPGDGALGGRADVRPGAGRRPQPAAHRARGDHLRDHPGPRTGGRRGRGAGPHRAGRGPAAGPGPRRRRGRTLGRPPRLPARRRTPRVRGGHPGRTRPGEHRGPDPRPAADAGAGRAGHPAHHPGRDRRGARDRGGRRGAGPARLEGRAGRACERWPSSAGPRSSSATRT